MTTPKQKERLHDHLRDLEEREDRGVSKPGDYFSVSETARRLGENEVARRLAVHGHKKEASEAERGAEEIREKLAYLQRRLRALDQVRALESGAARETAAGDETGAGLLHDRAEKERYVLRYQ